MMARYKTLDLEAAAKAVEDAGFEPLIVDGKFVAVIVGNLRIYPSKEQIVVSQLEALRAQQKDQGNER